MNNYSTENKFAPGLEFSSSNRHIQRISTGSTDLDNLFATFYSRGGVETRAITQFYGQSAVGKTQLCICLSIMVQQDQSLGGLNGNALYIDTEGKVKNDRIIQIAKSRGFDPHEALKNITVKHPQSVTEQELLLDKVESLIHSQNIKLLIVDSIINHYKAEYIGRENLPARQGKLYKFMYRLNEIANNQNIAVVITNHVRTSSETYGRGTLKSVAAGGHAVSHASTYIVFLGRSDYVERTAIIIASPYHPVKDIGFELGEQGVQNRGNLSRH
jgi:DNA repair protein RadA